MPLVNVMVNGRAYTLGCDEGEEGHLRDLAARVDTKVREALNIVGQNAGDGKLMLMAALLMADEQHEHNHKPSVEPAADHDDKTAERLESAAARLEVIAAQLEDA